MPHHHNKIAPRIHDDWRLQVDFEQTGPADALTAILDAHRLDHDLSEEFADRVIVSQDGPRLYVYAASEEQLERAKEALGKEARRQGWRVSVDVRRWHPIEEEWLDPKVPLPDDDAARRAERESLMQREREETAKRGYPEFEVRVTLPSHHAANALAETLRDEGLIPVKRWRFLVVGATDEESARALAEKIRAEAPPKSQAQVEGTVQAVHADARLARGPFSVFP